MRVDRRQEKARILGRESLNRSAFTLVEMLLALALAGLVVAVTGRIAVQSMRTQVFVEGQVFRSRRVAQLEAIVTDDVVHRLADVDTSLPTTITDRSRIVWEATVLAADLNLASATLHTVRKPALVRYRLESIEPEANRGNLIREVTDRTQPGALLHRETIATDLISFDADWLRRDAWQAAATVDWESARQAFAVRFTARWSNELEPWRKTFVLTHDR